MIIDAVHMKLVIIEFDSDGVDCAVRVTPRRDVDLVT